MKGIIYYFTEPVRACRVIGAGSGMSGPVFVFFMCCFFLLGSVSGLTMSDIGEFQIPLFSISFFILTISAGCFHTAFAVQGKKGNVISLLRCFLTMGFPIIILPLLKELADLAGPFARLLLSVLMVLMVLRGFYAALIVNYNVSKLRISLTVFIPLLILWISSLIILTRVQLVF